MKSADLNDTEQVNLNSSGLLLPLIQGYIGIVTSQIKGQKCTLSVLSRLSCKRAGTRFNARGIDDDGNVSNFVETELILFTKNKEFSFLQIRGSVPLFWEQTGLQMTHKITISRGAESTTPSLKKHLEDLKQRYSHLHIVNLLGQKESSNEFSLSENYKAAVSRLSGFRDDVVFTGFDYHAIVKRDSYERVSF